MTALWKLCANGKLNEVRSELANGGDVDNKDSTYGSTALMWSAVKGEVAAMKLLLMHGAGLHLQDSDGKYYLYML